MERILVVKSKEMWYVLTNISDPDIWNIIEDGSVGGANYTLESNEIEEFVKTHFCIVLHLSKKLIYMNGIIFNPPADWKRKYYISQILNPKTNKESTNNEYIKRSLGSK